LDYWFEPPINRLLAGGLLGIAGLSFSLCIRRFALACRQAGGMASAQWFVRAIRWLLIALTAFYQSWLLIGPGYEGAILCKSPLHQRCAPRSRIRHHMHDFINEITILRRRHIDIRSDDDAVTDFYPAAAAGGLIHSSSCTRSNERKAWPNRIGFHAVPIH
jgi:hypothetical protein